MKTLRHTLPSLVQSQSSPGKALWAPLKLLWPHIVGTYGAITKPDKLNFNKKGAATLWISVWGQDSTKIMYAQDIFIQKIKAYSGWRGELTVRFIQSDPPPKVTVKPKMLRDMKKQTTESIDWAKKKTQRKQLPDALQQALTAWGAGIHQESSS